MKRKVLRIKLLPAVLLLVVSAFSFQAQAQVTVGGSKTPEPFSILEILSNQKAGLRMPHLSTNERDDLTKTAEFQAQADGLAKGLTIYNTSIDCLEYWNSEKWVSQCQPVFAEFTIICDPAPELVDYDPVTGLSGTSSKTNGNYVVANSINPADMNPDKPQSIIVKVNVTKAGECHLSTNTANGVRYTGIATFDSAGQGEVVMTPSGKPLATGLQGNHIIYDVNNVTVNCTVSVPYAYRQFNIVSCAPEGGYYGFSSGNETTWDILDGTATFGTTGKLPCEANPVNTNYDVSIAGGSGALDASQLQSYINSHNADVLYLGQISGEADPAVIRVIEDFVFNKHGVVIFAEEYAGRTSSGVRNYATELVEKLFDANLTADVVRSTGEDWSTLFDMDYGGVYQSGTSEIVDGPFGDLTGRKHTLTYGVSGYIPTSNATPANAFVLSRLSTTNPGTTADNAILSIQNKNLGVYMTFDNTFGGNKNEDGNTMRPGTADATTGLPTVSAAGNVDTHGNNTMLFANLFAWALKYGAYNINSSYTVSNKGDLAYPSTFVPRKPVQP